MITGVENDRRKEVKEEGAGPEGEHLPVHVQQAQNSPEGQAEHNQQGRVGHSLGELFVDVED